MRTAAIFPIGTSVGGCPDAIAEILKEEPALEVYLLCGNRGAPDAPDPHDFAAQIMEGIRDGRVTWAQFQAVEPFDMSVTYAQVRAFVAGISERNYDRVYVGITGAANPVVASLFQTAMAYLSCQVIPIYVQARGAVRVRHFLASDVRDRVNAEEALATARSGQIRVAARLAERLPPEGWKFLRCSLTALSFWDDFDYSQAKQTLEHQARRSAEHAQQPMLAPLADTVTRIARVAGQMSSFANEICDVQNFCARVTSEGWAERALQGGSLLIADALANAQRRILEGRFTDSVLRSYRAAECATQTRLLAIGIHPAKVDACQGAYQRHRAAGAPEAEELAFIAGLHFLASAGQLDFAPIEKRATNLSSARNHTYLEHGYQRVQSGQAQRCFELSLEICQHLAGPGIDKRWQGFEMRF
ncbi:MAG TPA: hypothetical protein VN924_29250 [Bryobacteraceae bacterium]|nr:hypothetical protein [Bryobacteraceae bacterium]